MKKLLLLFLLISFTSQAQLKNIFKYSTTYISYDQNNSIQPMKSFAVSSSNELIDTTPNTPADETFTFGIRKLAFFEYENRDQFYNGSETNIGKSANVGNAKGLEYLFEISKGRQQRREFERVLTDIASGEGKTAMPMILVTSAVHSHLTRSGLRTFCSLNVRSAECIDPHYFAVLIGCGATVVNA